jgi:hypothetical protein
MLMKKLANYDQHDEKEKNYIWSCVMEGREFGGKGGVRDHICFFALQANILAYAPALRPDSGYNVL